MKYASVPELKQWLVGVMGEQRLVAPRKDADVLRYQAIDDVEEIVWDYIRPVQSAKEFLFPQTELLMKISHNGEDIQVQNPRPPRQTVLFGVRPCDAKGITVLDNAFMRTTPIDPYYVQRREKTVVVGMACQQMGETCFCTSVGGAPDDTAGMDLLLHPVDGGYLVEAVTAKGEALLDEIQLTESAQARPLYPFEPQQDLTLPEDIDWEGLFKSEIWDHHSQRCISCRVCAYVCPTCRCFDVRDEKRGGPNGNGAVSRIRVWDSCSGEAYRRIAGGHNPREAKADRLRNRIYCKAHYYAAQYGPAVVCTGCGRCVDSCPVNIDIREILGLVLEE